MWILILASLIMTLFNTTLLLINATRLNIEWGISDEVINGFIFFFGSQPISILAQIPVTVALTYIIPANIEASTMAVISAAFVWAYDAGAKVSCSIYCAIFEVNDEHMDNYPHLIVAKMPMIGVMALLLFILPSNKQISDLAAYLRK